MKKLIFLIAFAFACLSYGYAQPPAVLKDFKFYTTTGSAFSKANLNTKLATIVILFSPDCEHCQQQAKWIQEGAAKLKNVQIVWVSFHEVAKDIQEFPSRFLPSVKIPMYFLQDKNFEFDSYFGESNVPSIFVYDSAGKFVKDFRNEVEISKLAELIR